MSRVHYQDSRDLTHLPMLKRYHGRVVSGKGVKVTCNGQDVRHHSLHTEGPFRWGDASAGAADLAFSILWKHFHGRGTYQKNAWQDVEGHELLVEHRSAPAFYLYKQFHREVISHLVPGKEWVLTSDQIDQWFRQPHIQELLTKLAEIAHSTEREWKWHPSEVLEMGWHP